MPALLIKVNGEEREVSTGATLAELIAQLALVPERLAIERNREVVRRADWPRTQLAEGDRIEIVHFVGGGSEHARPPVSKRLGA